MTSDPPRTRWLVLPAGPAAPGADALWKRGTARGEKGWRLQTILSGAGLAWLEDPRLARLAARGGAGASVSVCSRSARERGVTLDDLPPGVGASGLVRWFGARPPGAPLWGLLP
ncbi:MAG: hypothetical protein ACC662_03130, partial [Planctomycetota bacterium]